MKKIRKLYKEIRRNTNYVAMKTKRKIWMMNILQDLEEVCKNHKKRIYLESKRTAILKLVNEEKIYKRRKQRMNTSAKPYQYKGNMDLLMKEMGMRRPIPKPYYLKGNIQSLMEELSGEE